MKKSKFLLLTVLASALGVGSFALIKNNSKEIFAAYTNGDGATYYSGISDSLTGDSLLSALRSLNSSKRQSTVGYSSMGTSPSGQFKYTDYVPSSVKYDSNGQPYGEQIVSFYSGNSTTAFNREHVWPNSHGGNVIENDIHMPRPTIASENGSRGNSFYVEGKCSSTSGWDPAMESFGEESYRGDSARIIFYCMLVDTKLSLIEADSHSTSNSNKDYMMGKLSDLVKWNINYPVQDREQRRNEGAEYLQGNRNPFIDHPEYVCRIWGNANSTTQSLCANATYPSVAHTAGIRIDDGYNVGTVNTTAYTLVVGDSVNFLPFVDGAFNSSVSWSLSDYDVASQTYYGRSTYTNGVTITALAAGTSTLTLSYSYDDNGETKTATAQVVITVNTSGNSGSGNQGGGQAEDVENETSATYTVASTSSVSTTGTAPTSSSASYSQTYSTKGQITSGKNAVLTLSGYAGKVITGITLNMKSNGSSGAGSLAVTAGSTSLASTSGNFNTWYDNTSFGTSYRDVHVDLTNSSYIIGTGESVTITITGSTNSLYINSYTITYGTPIEEDPEEVVLSSISASGMTQNYEVGDTFSFDGTLTATYSDGNEETVIPDSVSTPDMSSVGNKTVTLSYTEGGVTKTTTYTIYVSAKAATLSSISISGQTTTYSVGDTFSFDGTCTAHYSDSTSKSVTPTSVTSPNMSTAGNKSITVSYTEGGVTKTANYSITVNALVLSSIAVTTSPTKTTYYVGEAFSSDGLVVTASYTNGSSKVVTPTSISSPNMSIAGNKTVTVSYTESGVTKTTTFNITVSAVTLTSISVSGQKTNFQVDDTFSFGGTVTAHYNNSTTSDVTASATFSGYNMSTAGNQTVTVSYGGQTTTYTIQVLASGSGNPVIEIDTGGGSDGTYSLYSGALTEGNYLIVYDNYAMKNTVSSNRLTYESVSPSNDTISNPDASLIWHIAPSGNYWTIYNSTVEKYAASSGSKNQGALSSNGSDDKSLWTASGTSTYEFVNKYNAANSINAYLRKNGTYGYGCYASNLGSSGAVSLYKENVGSGSTQEVTITSIDVTSSVTAYHPGETLDLSKISVTGHYELESVDKTVSLTDYDWYCDSEDYMFTYNDANTGSKTITVIWEGLSDSFVVTVSRINYSAPSTNTASLTSSEVFSGIGGGRSNLQDGSVTYEGITYSYYQAYYYSSGGALSFGDSSSQSGYVTNQTPFNNGITNVTVSSSGRTVNIRYSVDGSNWVLKSAANVNTTTYKYVKVDCIGTSGSDYSNITNISITYQEEETAVNVANYIMYQDTVGQCTTRFNVAAEYFADLSKAERTTFMTSSDYVISTARTRFEAWAASLGQHIDYVNEDYTINKVVVPTVLINKENNATIIVAVSSLLGLSAVAGYFFIKKRKEQ